VARAVCAFSQLTTWKASFTVFQRFGGPDPNIVMPPSFTLFPWAIAGAPTRAPSLPGATASVRRPDGAGGGAFGDIVGTDRVFARPLSEVGGVGTN